MAIHNFTLIVLFVIFSHALAAPTSTHTESSQKQKSDDVNEGELTKLSPSNDVGDESSSDKLQNPGSQKPQVANKELNRESSNFEVNSDNVDESNLSSSDLDEGFDTILKDVLITLRDHPGIIKEIIDGEEKQQKYYRMPNLMDFQLPAPQLSLAPKRVEKKAGSKQFISGTQNFLNDKTKTLNKKSISDYYKSKYAHSSEDESSNEDDTSEENYYKMKYGHSSSQSGSPENYYKMKYGKSSSESESDESPSKESNSESTESDNVSNESNSDDSSASDDSDSSNNKIINVKRVPEQPEETIDLTSFAVQQRSSNKLVNREMGNWKQSPHSIKMNSQHQAYYPRVRGHPDPRNMLHHSYFQNKEFTLPGMSAPEWLSKFKGPQAFADKSTDKVTKDIKDRSGQFEKNLKEIEQQKSPEITNDKEFPKSAVYPKAVKETVTDM